VGKDEKADRVADVFDSVSRRYDLMNDLMTWGLHRRWKRRAVAMANVLPGQKALDLAGGTGDIAIRLAKRVGPTGEVVLSDINPSMLDQARRRLKGHKMKERISIREADAEQLPFADASFDVVTIGFGLRNVTNQLRALSEMLRVLKPGGRLVILEFSRPVVWLVQPFYDLYSFTVIPALGWLVAYDATSYRYLAESIRVHPDRETLLQMMRDAGFSTCRYTTMLFGIVAAHRGTKK
jgi:demethylmenaquinone methyltransferase/2-methoxy-6-polyprenyl-1,4-benzoquinol methylase